MSSSSISTAAVDLSSLQHFIFKTDDEVKLDLFVCFFRKKDKVFSTLGTLLLILLLAFLAYLHHFFGARRMDADGVIEQFFGGTRSYGHGAHLNDFRCGMIQHVNAHDALLFISLHD